MSPRSLLWRCPTGFRHPTKVVSAFRSRRHRCGSFQVRIATLLTHEEQHNIDPWAAHLQDDEAAVFIATSQRVRMKGTVRIVSCQNHGLVQRTSATWRCSGQPAALSLPLLNLWLRWCCDSHAASMSSGFHESIGPCRVDLGSNFLVRHDCTNSSAYIESA